MNRKPSSTMDFDAFVKRQQTASTEEEHADWIKERDDWLHYLNELYKQIESFLGEYIDRGEITISYHDIDLNEENIGGYKAPEMILKIGRQEVTMTPIGTLLVGAKGRVDVMGSGGRARLALVDKESTGPRIKVSYSIGGRPESAPGLPPKEISWTWKIATSPPTVQYVDLTQESFYQMLMEVANG